MALTLYGIKNCDTVRKARRWLDSQSIPYRYHDLRDDGLPQPLLQDWLARVGPETLINRRSPGWRKVPQEQRDSLDAQSAVGLLQETPTLIKRPVLDTGEQLTVGFNEKDWQTRLT